MAFEAETPVDQLLQTTGRLDALSAFGPLIRFMSSFRCFLLSWLCILFAHSLHAFSAYENHLIKGRGQQVGLIASINSAQRESFRTLLSKQPADLGDQLAKEGIRNLTIFEKEIDGSVWCFARFYFESSEREAAVESFVVASPWIKSLTELLTPHPRAEKGGQKWLRMEWICLLPGNPGKTAKEVKRMALVTGLKPEQESNYRALNQSVWPGVGDQMARSKVRDWTTFLVEIGPKLYLFSYYEYVGNDFESDMDLMKQDPATQRWWKFTDACQQPLPEMEGKGVWSSMAPVLLSE